MKLPEGYGSVRTPHAWGFAVRAGVDWLEQALAADGTLHAWAAARPERRELAGRGRVYSVPAPVPGPDDGTAGWCATICVGAPWRAS